MDNITIKDLRISDIDSVRHLRLSKLQSCFADSPESALTLSGKFKNSIPFGVFIGEHIIGFGIREHLTGEGTGGYLIWDFMIDKDHQGNGYGKSAFNKLIQAVFNKLGGEFIDLAVVPENIVAMSFYKKLGFQETGIINNDGEIELVLRKENYMEL